MLATLHYLSGFNNYYNRQLKLPSNTDIDSFSEWTVLTTPGSNFNPNDGVMTEHVVNYDPTDGGELDYLVVSVDNTTVDSRWFITEAKRSRKNQYTISLFRDLLAEYWQSIIQSPVYIQRAMISKNSKLIFNSEGSTFNQIKKSEKLLKDRTECGWIVGYTTTGSIATTVSVDETGASYPATPISYSTLNTWAQKTPITINKWTASYFGLGSATVPQVEGIQFGCTTFNCTGTDVSYSITTNTDWARKTDIQWNFSKFNTNTVKTVENAFKTSFTNRETEVDIAVNNFYTSKYLAAKILSDTDVTTLMSMIDNVYYDATEDKYFKISVTKSTDVNKTYSDINSGAGSLWNALYTNILKTDLSNLNQYPGNPNMAGRSGISISADVVKYDVNLEEVTLNNISVTISDSAKTLKDAPYRMFCIPFGDPRVEWESDQYPYFYPSKRAAITLASNIATKLGGTADSATKIYDLQLLPYCPARECVPATGTEVLLLGEEGTDYNIVRSALDNAPRQVIIWCEYSNFNFEIRHSIITSTLNNVDFKVANECDFYRLCSPNYSGTFEFKATSNYGVSAFEVNCSYKPYQPYIHLNPVFNANGLYGGDYNDQRGLVCSGDFSLPMIDDHWIDYQINNKSYADSFNRQVENMQTTFNIQQAQAKEAGIVGAISAAIGGGTGGAMIGSSFGLAGGAIGGIAGAVGSGLASAYGLQQDLKYSQQLQNEAVSYTKDMWQLNLQNIQALPYSLGKVGAFVIDNKIFPFLEYYTASDEEKEALRNRLTYRGFTLGVIDKPENYSTGWFQGSLIRYLPVEGQNLDYHATAALAAELNKGVYI